MVGGRPYCLPRTNPFLRTNQTVRERPYQHEHHRVGGRLDRQALARGQGQQNTGGQRNEQQSHEYEGPHFVYRGEILFQLKQTP